MNGVIEKTKKKHFSGFDISLHRSHLEVEIAFLASMEEVEPVLLKSTVQLISREPSSGI